MKGLATNQYKSMNWGTSIIAAFILFAGFIATLVVVCVRQDISLVSKNYYKDELAYQDQIQRLNNTAELKEKPVIKVVGRQLQIEYSQFSQVDRGEVKLFCPSNTAMDRDFKIGSSNEHTQYFKLDSLQKGMYRVKLRWSMKGKEFYKESIINI
jgi:hypothetical protein